MGELIENYIPSTFYNVENWDPQENQVGTWGIEKVSIWGSCIKIHRGKWGRGRFYSVVRKKVLLCPES